MKHMKSKSNNSTMSRRTKAVFLDDTVSNTIGCDADDFSTIEVDDGKEDDDTADNKDDATTRMSSSLRNASISKIASFSNPLVISVLFVASTNLLTGVAKENEFPAASVCIEAAKIDEVLTKIIIVIAAATENTNKIALLLDNYDTVC